MFITDEMYQSDANDKADDFPKVAAGAYLTVVIGVKFVSTFVNWGYQSLIPNIGEDARAEDDVKEFKYSQLEGEAGTAIEPIGICCLYILSFH